MNTFKKAFHTLEDNLLYEVTNTHNLTTGRTVAGDVPFFIRIAILNSIARSDFFKAV